jgi:hypothetical protein
VGYTDWRAAAQDAASLIRRLRRPSKRQVQMDELRRDVDACLKIFDHLSTGGSGDWSAQWAYVDQVLREIGKRGISGAGDWLDELRGN